MSHKQGLERASKRCQTPYNLHRYLGKALRDRRQGAEVLQEADTGAMQHLSEGERKTLVELLRKVAHGRALHRKSSTSPSQDFRQIV